MSGEVLEKKELINYLVEIRHKLHKIPEIGTDLPLTVKFVCDELTHLGLEYRVVDHGGIIASLGQGERAILLRADMDALPIEEQSGEEFASANGNMHACGHDLHTTMLLGAAKLLKEKEEELRIKVVLLFEFGEETGKGMTALINEKVFDGMPIDHAIALHVLPGEEMEPGTYICHEGPANTSFSMFDIKVKGKTAHGAMLFKGKNPINAGVQIYNAITNLVLFEMDARKTALISPCYFLAGELDIRNVIPEEAVIGGTVRTLALKDTLYLDNRIREITESVSKGMHMESEVVFDPIYPAAVNSPETVRLVNESAKEIGMKNLDRPPQMVSDTFAFLTQMFSGAYIWIGAGGSGQKYKDGILHSPKVCYNDDTLFFGANLFYKAALKYSSEVG